MTGTGPQRGGELIPFPQQAGTQVPPTPEVGEGEVLTEQHDTAAVLGALAGLCARMVMLAWRLAASPRTAQAWAVVGYRLRKAPRDTARLGWFFLRGHGRWIAKGWMWATHGHLRADARAAWLAGDVEARRSAQELIRSNARIRWAKIGLAAHRVTTAALLAMFLGGVLL